MTDRTCDARRGAPIGHGVARTALLAASLLAAACATKYSEAPLAKNFAVAAQQKPQSSSHWQSIADRVVGQLKQAIGNKPVFVAPGPAGDVEFPQVFRRQVQAALVGSGVKVVKQNVPRSDVLVLDVDARLVRFSSERAQNRSLHAVGAPPPGVMHDWWDAWYDALYASGRTPEFELVVMLSLSNATHVVGQRTETFYIADGDRGLYEPMPKAEPAPPPPPQTIRVSGGR